MAGNWKMNNTIPEAVVLAQEISNRMERDWLELVDVAVCPPFVDLKPVKSVFEFDQRGYRRGRPERLLGAEGRVYRRDFHRHDQEHSAAPSASWAIPSAATSSARPTRK